MKVMFVCVGNTCRSPMLKYMFEDYAKHNNLDVYIDSAGMINHKKPMNENTIKVLQNKGIPFVDNESKFLSKELFDEQDLVFVMTKEIKEQIVNNYGHENKVQGLYEIINEDVFDPYNQGYLAYEKVYGIFDSMLENIAKILKIKQLIIN